jgi:hypothetical protein
MAASDVGDLGPIGLVVAGRALLAAEAALMRILVTGNTVASKPQVGRIPATVANIVTLRTADGPMRAFQRPTRHPMVEARLASPRPANELGVPPEVLDVAAPALLLLILGPAVKPLAGSNASPQVVVASEASIGVDALAGRVALAAVGVSVDVGVWARKLAGGKELRTALSWDEGPRNDCDQHHATDDDRRRDAAVHCEKIHR